MDIETFTLSEAPLNWDVQFPFPNQQRRIIEEAMREIEPENPPYPDIDELLSDALRPHEYYSEFNRDDEVFLWRPDHSHSVDLYSPNQMIAIEIEKTERKRVVHDLLKIYNGGLTFVPRVRYGVLIYPAVYISGTGTIHNTFGTNAVVADLEFYFRPLFSRGEIQDILCIAYSRSSEEM